MGELPTPVIYLVHGDGIDLTDGEGERRCALEARTAVNIRHVLLVLLAILAAFLAGYFFRGWMEVDRCLDRGGRWNDAMAACEYIAQAGS